MQPNNERMTLWAAAKGAEGGTPPQRCNQLATAHPQRSVMSFHLCSSACDALLPTSGPSGFEVMSRLLALSIVDEAT